MSLFKYLWVMGLCLGLLACKDEENNKPVQRQESAGKTVASQAGATDTAPPYAHTKTIKCVFESQDGTLKTTSSYFKYDPNTKDPISLDMLEFPDPVRQDRLNYMLERTKITDARVEIPLPGGNQVFTLVGTPYFNGSTSMTFHEPRGGTKGKTSNGFWFGARIKGNLWEGVLTFSNGDTNWAEGSWHFQAGGNPQNAVYGPARCEQIGD